MFLSLEQITPGQTYALDARAAQKLPLLKSVLDAGGTHAVVEQVHQSHDGHGISTVTFQPYNPKHPHLTLPNCMLFLCEFMMRYREVCRAEEQ